MTKRTILAGSLALLVLWTVPYAGAETLKVVAAGDARLVNFEAVINDGTCPPAAWSGGTWASMGPSVLPDFLAFGFNGCGCANNHSVDFSHEGLKLTEKSRRSGRRSSSAQTESFRFIKVDRVFSVNHGIHGRSVGMEAIDEMRRSGNTITLLPPSKITI